MAHGGSAGAGGGTGGARGPGGVGATGSAPGGAGAQGKKGKKDKDKGFSPSEALTTGFSVAGLPGAIVGLGTSMATRGEGPSTKGPTMSGGGSTPSGPRGNATLGSEDLPSVPSAENSGDALSAAEDAQRERDARRRGRASTILTGGQGLRTAAPVARRTLMGS